MRIYLGGILQETNTFCPNPTDVSLFDRGYHLRAENVSERLAGTNTEIGGFLDFLSAGGDADVVCGTAAWAVASGKIVRRAFDLLVSELLEDLEARMPVDGVLLALHGSLVCEDIEDCEGYILQRVRRLAGDDVRVVATLDYHACVTRAMIEHADLLLGYRTYPHVDFAETGKRAAGRLLEMIRERRASHRPVLVRLPLILPVENTETEEGPMSAVMRQLHQMEARGAMSDASIFCPQPWIDVRDHGVSVLAYGRCENETAGHVRKLAGLIWRARDRFLGRYPKIDEFVNSVDRWPRPIALVDSGDITSAGGAGDSTVILRALLKSRLGLRAVIPIVDARAVARAAAIGTGSVGTFRLGGGSPGDYNAVVEVSAKVASLSDSRVRVGGDSFAGLEIDVGNRALLELETGVRVLVFEYASLIHDPEVLRSVGIAPEECDLIVQKSHKLFRAGYRDIVRSVVALDTPGCTSMNLNEFPFERVRRPIFPLDAMADRSLEEVAQLVCAHGRYEVQK